MHIHNSTYILNPLISFVNFFLETSYLFFSFFEVGMHTVLSTYSIIQLIFVNALYKTILGRYCRTKQHLYYRKISVEHQKMKSEATLVYRFT
jgi:hypothetical protein